MSEACAGALERLPSVFPGSWINGDFYIWIGHADDHRAWSQLAEARRALETPSPGLAAASLARAREEMLIAEGSDWFWWYGDDHSSSQDLDFDDLFRRHVRNVYRALEKPIPEELFVTNITTEPPEVEVGRPSGFIRPVIDGRVTSYFEWIGAGCVEGTSTQASMHQVSEREPGLTLIEFGFDLEHLYVRVDGALPMQRLLGAGMELSLNFLQPAGVRVTLEVEGDVPAVRVITRKEAGRLGVGGPRRRARGGRRDRRVPNPVRAADAGFRRVGCLHRGAEARGGRRRAPPEAPADRIRGPDARVSRRELDRLGRRRAASRFKSRAQFRIHSPSTALFPEPISATSHNRRYVNQRQGVGLPRGLKTALSAAIELRGAP